jgi:hypothetical protein
MKMIRQFLNLVDSFLESIRVEKVRYYKVIVYFNSACTDIYSCVSEQKVAELEAEFGDRVEIVEEVDYEEVQRQGKAVKEYFELRRAGKIKWPTKNVTK